MCNMYEVSEKIQEKLNQLTANDKVKNALEFAEKDNETVIEKQIELALIPAPTGQEQQKAEQMLKMFREEGLEDCHIDESGNCVGIRKGTGGGRTVLMEAHMDTVFPMDTKLEIVREDGFIKCPGISDDTRGCAVLISVIRALNAADIKTKGDIHFVGTVMEEGTGSFRGMKNYCNHHPELESSISIDGPAVNVITYEEVGLQTYEITFHGKGGHVFGDFGRLANPLHAAGRAIAKIADIKIPEDTLSTYGVTSCHGGNISSIHAIVPSVTLTLNYRSDSQEALEQLEQCIFAAIEEACQEETDRWGKNTITYTSIHHCDAKVGKQDPHSPIVEAAFATAKFLGAEPILGRGAATNLCGALEAGLPGICLGLGSWPGNYNIKCHSLEEQFMPADAYKGAQQALLMALLCAGTDISESIIKE